MDIYHVVLTVLTSLLSGGTIPYIVKLIRDKNKLKREKEHIQNKKIELLAEILVLYINNNGTKENIKKECNNLLKTLKKIGEQNG